MWGEIETPAQTRPRQFCDGDADEVSLACEPTAMQPDALDDCGSNIPAFIPKYCPQPQLDKITTRLTPFCTANVQPNSRADANSVFDMVEAVALSDSPVKSQQIGEAELTLEERREELVKQYRARPLVFFERYQAHLKPQHLVSFAHLISDPRAQHYCRVVLRRASSRTDRTRVRNQRYAALRALQKEGEYFSEEQMRVREPLLYEQYVGQYLSEEEVLERSQEAMRGGGGGGGGEPGAPGGGAGGLANLLLDSYQERLLQHRMQEQQEREEGAQEEEEEDEEEEEARSRVAEWEPNPEEKALLREEFVSQMHQRFLDGKDKDFNYREVDENPDYDNLDIVSRDAEEKYFADDDDDDDDGEEEEDTEEEEDEADEERKKRDSEEEDMIP